MKPRFTFEQHQEAGARLKAIRDYLTRLSCEIGNAYPKTSREAIGAHKAAQAVDHLRVVMDSAVFAENRGRDTGELIRVYFPGSRGES